VDLHGAIVLRVAGCVKKMAAALADISRNLPLKPKAKVRNPGSDPLRRRDRAARRSPMAEIRNANTRANEIFPPPLCFPAWDFGFLSGLAVPVSDARLVQIVG
jgi:hypothetical protein